MVVEFDDAPFSLARFRGKELHVYAQMVIELYNAHHAEVTACFTVIRPRAPHPRFQAPARRAVLEIVVVLVVVVVIVVVLELS